MIFFLFFLECLFVFWRHCFVPYDLCWMSCLSCISTCFDLPLVAVSIFSLVNFALPLLRAEQSKFLLLRPLLPLCVRLTSDLLLVELLCCTLLPRTTCFPRSPEVPGTERWGGGGEVFCLRHRPAPLARTASRAARLLWYGHC